MRIVNFFAYKNKNFPITSGSLELRFAVETYTQDEHWVVSRKVNKSSGGIVGTNMQLTSSPHSTTTINSLLPKPSSNRSNMKHLVWAWFQTPKRELKIWRTVKYFWWASTEVFKNEAKHSLSMFDMSSQSKLKLRTKRTRRNNANWDQIFKYCQGNDFLCSSLKNY